MSARGRGCVKTRNVDLLVEASSRFRRSENKLHRLHLPEEENRENNSAHSALKRVFTQPRSNSEAAMNKSASIYENLGSANDAMAPITNLTKSRTDLPEVGVGGGGLGIDLVRCLQTSLHDRLAERAQQGSVRHLALHRLRIARVVARERRKPISPNSRTPPCRGQA